MQPLDEQGRLTVGNRIRRIRLQQELSIRSLAEQAGVSKTSIVHIEAGKSIRESTLLKVATILGLHLDRLAKPTVGDATPFAKHTSSDDAWYDLIRFDQGKIEPQSVSTKNKRQQLAKNKGVVPLNILASRLEDGRIKPTILELFDPSPIRSHVGEEFVMVLEGKAIISIGQSKVTLCTGESVTFWSAEPHGYAPAPKSKLPTRILSVRVDSA